MIGSSSAKSYSRRSDRADHCGKLLLSGGECLNGDGANAAAEGITSKTTEELKSPDMVTSLGGSYIDQAGGYPMLGWQDPNAEYTVTFTLLTQHGGADVWQGETTYRPGEDGAFHLKMVRIPTRSRPRSARPRRARSPWPTADRASP